MTGVMIFFLLGCFLCACGKTKDQTRKTTKDTNKQIIIGGDNYPPFNYTDENGNPAGIDVELAKEAFHRMGYKPVFVNIDWENKKKLVEQGKIDCIWAPWCGYCRRIGAAYEKISEEYSDILIAGKVNIDEEPQIAEAEKIEIIPTLVLYRDGKAIDSIVAPESKIMIENFINEALEK